MAPKSPWAKKTTPVGKKHLQTATSAGDAGFPQINYAEVQDEELEVLQAIYMEDFHRLDAKNAWSVTTDQSFKIVLRADTDPEAHVNLLVTLTATYPKSVPVLDVQGLDGFHERTKKRILNIVEFRPKQLLGEVMIDAISSEIREALQDAVDARAQGTLPSLEEERAIAEETAIILAKEAEEAELLRVRQAQEEEDRVLRQMVDEEIYRRGKKRSNKPVVEVRKESDGGSLASTIIFDQPAKIRVANNIESFNEVAISGIISTSEHSRMLLGRPLLTSGLEPILVAVKRTTIERDRSGIIEIEKLLENLKCLSHANLINVLVFRVDKIDDLTSELIICQDYADRGTLYDILSLSDLHPSKARNFTTELLEALDYLHHNGISHGGISPKTVQLVSHPALSPKLADFGTILSPRERDNDTPLKWRSPDEAPCVGPAKFKIDIWDIGLVVVQMFMGLSSLRSYSSPATLMAKADLSDAFEDLLNKLFANDAKKRPSAFDLLPAEFLRTEIPVTAPRPALQVPSSLRKSSSGMGSPTKRRSRHGSAGFPELASRYVQDFTEIGRLGRGGFGEVVKARNKLDGGIYAVKKIRQMPQLLDQVLTEVMLLNRLNHPYVVRYFSTWVENELTNFIPEDAVSATDDTISDRASVDFGYQSTGGLDFVSSNGYPGFEFADDDDGTDEYEADDTDDASTDIFDRGEDDDDSNDDDEIKENDSDRNEDVRRSNISPRPNSTLSSSPRNTKSRSESRRLQSTLYIQMEFCERRTMRDLIHRNMLEDSTWQYVRQITEGLAHIHSHGIIHRDLKPDNIFIDVAGNPKIGDFGLATTGRFHAPESHAPATGPSSKSNSNADMTKSIGTALYVAPELQSSSSSSYNEKVDMYSLGIICFEMWQPFSTAMERIAELSKIRLKDPSLPPAFQANGEKAAEGKLVSCLISHKPSERPSSTELLRSDVLPVKIEDETIQLALSGLSDPRSPYHQKMMSALFAHDAANSQRVKALAWDIKSPTAAEDPRRNQFRMMARAAMESVFKRHGAAETKRDTILPRSGYYTNAGVVQLLDASGNLLQLPYDLTLPHARQLARQPTPIRCSYAFGFAYRDAFSGGPPRVNEEADFDIICNVREDSSFIDDAEVIKVLDEVVSELPLSISSTGICFQINHHYLLDAILDHCRVPSALRSTALEMLSKLGFQQWTWAKLRPDLRNLGLSDTTLDDLQQFDWRDAPIKAYDRLIVLFTNSSSRTRTKCNEALAALRQVLAIVAKFGVHRPIYVSPLSCFNAKFYEGGILLQCVLERKTGRIVIAAGGRYDSLIRAHRPPEQHVVQQGAVGLCIGVEAIVTTLVKSFSGRSKSGSFLKGQHQQNNRSLIPKRCDVLVIAGGSSALHDTGLQLLSTLWTNKISAELASTFTSTDEQNCIYVVAVRHHASTTVRITNTEHPDAEDVDVAIAQLVTYLQQDMRERNSHHRSRPTPALLRHHSSHHDGEPSSGSSNRTNTVHVLLARHGSKKSNKYHIVEAAQQRWVDKLTSFRNAPILAVETRDDVIDLIQETRLGDAETWRKAVQSVQLSERQYVQQVQVQLESWRRKWVEGDGQREACVFNFRTGNCIYYDLGQ